MATQYEIHEEIQKMFFYKKTCNDILWTKHRRHVAILLNRMSDENVKKIVCETRRTWENLILLYCLEKAKININAIVCFTN